MGEQRFAVSRFQNQIRTVTPQKELRDRAEAKRWGTTPNYEYFDTEAEAAAHIIGRATVEVLDLERKLARARSRLGQIRKKFGPLTCTPSPQEGQDG